MMSWKGQALTGLLVLCLFMSYAHAAKRVDAARRALEVRARRQAEFTKRSLEGDSPVLDEVLELTPSEGLDKKRSAKTKNGIKYGFEERYMDIPVYDTVVSAKLDANGQPTEDVHGTILQEIELDLADTESAVTDDEAVQIAKDHNGDSAESSVKVVGVEKKIYQHPTSGAAHLTKFVTYDVDSKAKSLWPEHRLMETVVDSKDGKVLRSLNILTNSQHRHSATGGNVKIGKVLYTADNRDTTDNNIYEKLNITREGNTCFLENSFVKVLDMENQWEEANFTTFQFDCDQGYNDTVNGAYSPLSDALAYGEAVNKMFLDWYNENPLSFKLVMRVHFGQNYQNAFWDGRQMTFGDGGDVLYPLVCLDVTAHEVAHGVTTQNSNLIYAGQSGGMNEAFSDMAGEATEYYVRGKADWFCGYDIMKEQDGLRWLFDPPQDGISIDDADNFHPYMDVHHSSGVFNKAFYLLSNTPGWDIRKAFDIMVQANKLYWHASSTFDDGACGAIKAARDYGYEEEDVIAAFEQVGLTGCVDMSEVRELVAQTPMKVLSTTENGEKFVARPIFSAVAMKLHIYGGVGTAELFTRSQGMPSTRIPGRNISLENFEDSVALFTPPEPVFIIIKAESDSTYYVKVEYEQVPAIYENSPVSDISSDNYNQITYQFYLSMPAQELRFMMEGGTGSAVLIVKHNAMVSPMDFDQYEFFWGNTTSLVIQDPSPGLYFLGLIGYPSVSGLTLTVQTTPKVYPLNCDQEYQPPPLGDMQSLFGRVQVSSDVTELVFQSKGGEGNADIYVRAGQTPDLNNYDASSENPDNEEKIMIQDPASTAAEWYVQLYAKSHFSGMTFTVACSNGNSTSFTRSSPMETTRRGTKLNLKKRGTKLSFKKRAFGL